MSELRFDHDGFVDMSTFRATDPDAALGPSALAGLRDSLVAGRIPELDDASWSGMVRGAVNASASAAGPDDLTATYGLQPEHLLPAPAAGEQGHPEAAGTHDQPVSHADPGPHNEDGSWTDHADGWHDPGTHGPADGHGDDHPRPGHHQP